MGSQKGWKRVGRYRTRKAAEDRAKFFLRGVKHKITVADREVRSGGGFNSGKPRKGRKTMKVYTLWGK